ncbi:hypothetical protein ACEPPN_007500 [Leptodophora sp. 'Broadleaf-Isolate-01']
MDSKSQGRVYFLDLGLVTYPNVNGRILSCLADGSDLRELLTGMKSFPDGLAIDATNNHLYWTNMGSSVFADDGTIQRCDIETGKNVVTIVPTGFTHTPKQVTIARPSGEQEKLFWCDREGMKVMRCNLDGSCIETLVSTGDPNIHKGDATRWCVGIAVDTKRKHVYWTQKGGSKGHQGRIFRAGLNLPSGAMPDNRTDIELMFSNLPEPVDLEFDETTETLYWTDRGDPPFGNSVNSAGMEGGKAGIKRRLLVRKLHEGVGIALDIKHGRMFFTDIGGGVYAAKLDGSGKKILCKDIGDCTGIAFYSAL